MKHKTKIIADEANIISIVIAKFIIIFLDIYASET